DNRQIAFTSSREGSPSIYVMNRDGSGQRPVLPGTPSHLPGWARDGKSLFFINTSGVSDRLQRVSLEDGTIRTMVDPGGMKGARLWHPAPSPDGRWVAYVSNQSGDFRVWVYDLLNKKTRFLNPSRVSMTDRPTQQAAHLHEVSR
ncbi:MAG TPA: hypothetical protein VLB09_03000, partial [Nitrospiria bacterium]|nr:hypothetical protein [Nitrospiria bacterium]